MFESPASRSAAQRDGALVQPDVRFSHMAHVEHAAAVRIFDAVLSAAVDADLVPVSVPRRRIVRPAVLVGDDARQLDVTVDSFRHRLFRRHYVHEYRRQKDTKINA